MAKEPDDTEDLFKDFNIKEEAPKQEKPKRPKKSQLLRYKDEGGNISEPQDLSDLNRNNLLMERTIEVQEKQNEISTRQIALQEQDLKRKQFKDNWNVFITIILLALLCWFIWYVISNNVVNNILSIWATKG